MHTDFSSFPHLGSRARESANGLHDSLGEFQSPEHAVDYLARGVNCPTLDIPGQLDDWEIVHV
ncbi:MAG: hypothetical protein VB138_07755 [Burkholderia sp.]